MPSTTNLQKAAFDAIDTLHFGQVLMSFIYGRSIADWYHYILTLINEALQKKGISGKQAEITKHYLLSALEIYLSVDNKYISDLHDYSEENNSDGTPYNRDISEQFIEHRRNYSLSLLCAVACENGVDKKFIVQTTAEWINNEKLGLSTMPALVRNRLVECCYAIEYPDAPLRFYHELVNHNIILCGKHSSKKDKYAQELGSELSLLFIRAGLLFEFKMQQRAMEIMTSNKNNYQIKISKLDFEKSRISRKNIADYYKRLIDIWLLEKNPSTFAIFRCKEHVSKTDAEKILKTMRKFYLHKRMFGGTQGNWLGTLGAFEIELCCKEEPKRAIYYETNNSLTISDKVKSKLLDYGFNVSARSLYLRHKAIKKEGYSKILYYYHSVLGLPYIPPWYLNKNDLYDLALEYKAENVNE
ncbi:hypothetical protein [Providencia burhodogranariea]|uniref:Uncharacterized protein n=1 Tax=Providencia burhodogranariea DSM 19968 TaxID=1141662 RepID=K8X4F9_9GAMM|nr:hypothetical protein [Providencia burhodogranariea]EKT64552.1 hypothetical protein OOA_02107 [Providencia burhodogranariea DSM 19968]